MSKDESRSMRGVTPYPLAMVICDGIWQDPCTGKYTLLGTFSTIGGREFPLVHPILSVYISLTDGQGLLSVRLKLVDVDETRAAVVDAEQRIEVPDPRTICDICFSARNVCFPAAGDYRLQLFANDEFVIERRILLVHTTSTTTRKPHEG